MNDIRIFDATYSDVADLVDLRRRLYEHMKRRNPILWGSSEKNFLKKEKYYKLMIDTPTAQVLVARSGETVVGMAVGIVQRHDEFSPESSGQIEDLWVDPQWRRQGVCRRMVARLLEFFRGNGITHLALTYTVGNTEAEAVWRRLGFEPALVTANATVETLSGRLSG